MLQIKDISKQYVTGELVQQALNHVSLNLRDTEFVSILGPSGSGKTTLLNIIGGLDRYDDGDLQINGISTKKFKDRDWDAYRNHTIGFVFQSYNLIPHQSVLANVELALTIGGITGKERKDRAVKALAQVGLSEHIHKKPNQLSGGQMQRVAIARALVNNPDILLADEPTGALDTETSIQIMELLKDVAKDRLVVMVTHNPELAHQYSTRIVELKDGKIINDTDPLETEDQCSDQKGFGKAQMALTTSLALSAQNLRTKKARTFLTAFAGSIGIIGIALIVSLSTGVNDYITNIQKDTMASYPIVIEDQTFDLTSVMQDSQVMSGNHKKEAVADENRQGIYTDNRNLKRDQTIENSVVENDLTEFKKYLDDPQSEIHDYLGENGIVYSYDVTFDVFATDADGAFRNTNADPNEAAGNETSVLGSANQMNPMAAMFGTGTESGADNFSEMIPGTSGETVSPLVKDNYDLVYGAWPETYDEVMLVLNENNGIDTGVLYQLGLITADRYLEICDEVTAGTAEDQELFAYQDIDQHTFQLVQACDRYEKNENGTFSRIENDTVEEKELAEDGLSLKISGILRPKRDSENTMITTAVVYTSALTDYMIEHGDESAVIKAQSADESINVLNGMAFKAADDAGKAADAKAYISGLGISAKASLFMMIRQQNTEDTSDAQPSASMPSWGGMDETAMASAMDQWLENTPDQALLVSIYDQYIKGASYAENMSNFGKVSYDAPDRISIYTDSFEDKDAIAECITKYNEGRDKEAQIVYTDYVALMTSSITSIVDVISYVLIAFAAVSLVVSCIMIGIITHISVLERTKEIGILRALGASKRNISQVFNAETFIIGLCSGILGVVISVILDVPITMIVQKAIDTDAVRAYLPVQIGAGLILLSMVITMIGGLLPAKKAAGKDPVIALRSE